MLCLRRREGGLNRYRDPSVCLSQPRLSARWLPAAGRPPETCRLRTRPRTDVDPPRVELPPARGGHIVSPPLGRQLVQISSVQVVRRERALRAFTGLTYGVTTRSTDATDVRRSLRAPAVARKDASSRRSPGMRAKTAGCNLVTGHLRPTHLPPPGHLPPENKQPTQTSAPE